jgi:multiple sugar transport system permease protein
MATTTEKIPALTGPAPGLGKRLQLLLGRDWKEAYVFILPTIILMGGIIAIPFMQAVYLSFTRTNSLQVGPFIGLENYINLWTDEFFRQSVWITVKYTVSAVVFKFFVGMTAALLLHRMKRFAAVFTGLVLLPWIMPEIVKAITWRALLDPIYGGISRPLMAWGLIDQPLPFFGDASTALPSVIMVNLWAGIPFFTIILLAGLKAIDKELYEAAAIDGASAWRQFLHVTLPGLRYVIIVETLLSTIWTFNGFSLVFLLTGGGPVGATKVYSILSYEYAIASFRLGAGIAVAMTMAPLLGILIMILGRYMMAGQRMKEVVHDEHRGPVMEILYLLAWPFRLIIGYLVKLFWLVNDLVERILAAIGTVFNRLFFRSKSSASVRRKVRLTRYWVAFAAAVVLSALLFFELAPFYWVLVTSFKSNVQITTLTSIFWPEPWTWEQYRVLFGPTRDFLVWVKNTTLISIATPTIATIVASLGAYSLTRLRWRGGNTFSSLVLVAYLMPGVMMLIPIYLIFNKIGLINSLWGLIFAYPTFALPFAMWLMMGYYAAIPEELEDAARIDGCNRFQVFFKVVLPLTKPALLAVFLFGITQAWNEFMFAFTFIYSESKMTLPVGLGQMIIGDVLPWGELAAAAVLMAIPIFLLYTLGQRFMVQGLTAGAVKGGA